MTVSTPSYPTHGLQMAKQRLIPAAYLIGALLVLSLIIGWLGSDRLASSATEALVYVMIVVGLSIFIGNSGIVSFGHISFALIGVYATAWQSCCGALRVIYMPGLPDWLSTVEVPPVLAGFNGALIASIVALVVGVGIMRLNGVAASIASLCLLFVVKTVYENWDNWTGGQSTIVGLPTYVDLKVAWAGAASAILVATLYRTSTFGLRLRASREDEPAARAAGVNVWLQRLIAFVLSAFVVAVGGIFYGHFLGAIALSMFWLDMTFLTLAMLVIGGMNSMTGAVAGSLLVAVVREMVQFLERGVQIGSHTFQTANGTRDIVLALVLLTILIVRPQGLTGNFEWGSKR